MSNVLSKLIYLSKDSANFTEQDAKALAEKWAIRNGEFHLTGFLTLNNGMFIQYLEGNRSNLESIWSLIQNDERHIINKSFRYETTGKHFFPDWKMNYISSNSNKDLLTDIIFTLVETLREPLSDEDIKSLESMIQDIE